MRRLVLVFMLACLALVPAATSFAQTSTYTVQPGDNLYRISLRFGVSVAALAQANNIGNANLIFVGQVLQVPAGGSSAPAPATPAPGGVSQPTGSVGSYTVQPGIR